MYFLVMASAWPFTAVAKARRASSPSVLILRYASRGNFESMAINFLSRSLITASAASPLEKRYCVAYCAEGRESSSNRSSVTSPREPRDLAPPRIPSRVCAVWDICFPACCTSPSCDQISQIQRQLGEVQQAGKQMSQTAQTLEGILGGAKSRGSLGEVTLERLLEDSLPSAQYAMQYRFSSGEAADAVIKLRDQKLMAIDSKFPLDAYRRISVEGDEARRAFATAIKGHADAITKKYIVPDEGTLDVALMFVPSESVYYELLMTEDSKG